jgi:hypothetical protein
MSISLSGAGKLVIGGEVSDAETVTVSKLSQSVESIVTRSNSRP